MRSHGQASHVSNRKCEAGDWIPSHHRGRLPCASPVPKTAIAETRLFFRQKKEITPSLHPDEVLHVRERESSGPHRIIGLLSQRREPQVYHSRWSQSPARMELMPHFNNQTLEVALYAVAAVVLLFLGYRAGRWIGSLSASKALSQKEQDLFTAQKGFKNLYEQELAKLKSTNE